VLIMESRTARPRRTTAADYARLALALREYDIYAYPVTREIPPLSK
jgi:hypothetical protein